MAESTKPLIKKLKSVEPLRALMAAYFNELNEAATQQTAKVAWCTSVGPAELLRAFGFRVHFPENHGAMIEAMQRGTSKQSGYLLVIDESAYVARMQADASLAPRIAERARNWRAFGAARNQPTAVVDLGRLRTGAEPDPSVVSDIQEALRRPVSA